MSKKNTKSDVIRNKKYSIKLLNNLLEKYITDESTLRKADLMSKWIVDYVRYIDFEGTFDPRKTFHIVVAILLRSILGLTSAPNLAVFIMQL